MAGGGRADAGAWANDPGAARRRQTILGSATPKDATNGKGRQQEKAGGIHPGLLLHVARSYDLSAYDASYLELAIRLGLPLGSLDDKLKATAASAGVAEFKP